MSSHETDRCLGSRSGGALNIFVPCYQSETSGRVPAASHWAACPDITRLSAAARVRPWQLCIDHLEGDSAAFLFSCHCIGCTESAWRFRATKRYCVVVLAGIASFPFLTSTALDRAYDDSSTPQVSFSWNAKTLRNCRGFVFPHITCLQETWVQPCQTSASGTFVLLPSIEKRIYSFYFYLSRHRHRPWPSGALGFISEMSQNDAQSLQMYFNKQDSLTARVRRLIMRSNCVTPFELNF